MSIDQYWNRIIFTTENISFSVGHLFTLLLGIIILILFTLFTSAFLKKSRFISGLSERLVKVVLRTIQNVVWLIGLLLLLKIIKVNIHAFLSYVLLPGDKVDFTVQKLVILILLIFSTRLLVLLVDYLMNRKIQRDGIDFGKGKSVTQITKYLVWTVGMLISIGSLGLNLTFVIASASALLVGVGFGLQNIFNDFFSGIIILFDGSIKVGDVVQLEDVVGKVQEIGIRTTKILTRDNIVMIIPNSRFTHDSVINWSHMDNETRFSVSVGVAYGSDVKAVKDILLECAQSHSEIEKDPAPFVRFEDFGDSSLNFRLLFWSANNFRVENIKSDLRFLIDMKFRENNITIPFPQRDIHIISNSNKLK